MDDDRKGVMCEKGRKDEIQSTRYEAGCRLEWGHFYGYKKGDRAVAENLVDLMV